MIHIQTINNEKVKPIPLPKVENEKIKGFEMFPEVYSNIFLVARKKSGKTSVIWKILKSCAGKKTNVIIFSSTIHKDANIMHIIKHFKNKGNSIESYTSIKEDGEDKLKELLDRLKNEYEEESSEDEEKIKHKINLFREEEEEKDRKARKPSKLYPEYIIIFDDIGNELKNPVINQLLKTNRHYKSKVILSSQYVNDLSPESRKQIDYWILFGGHKMEKLKIIYDDADINIPFEDFINLYIDATKEKYNFLYIDTRDVTFRKNFNKLYKISE